MKQHRTLWIWLMSILIGGSILFGAFQLDPAVQDWRQRHRWKNITVLSRNVTRATDWAPHLTTGLVLAAIAWLRGNKKWMRVFLAMIAAGILAGSTAHVLKITTGRVRPSVKVEKVWHGLGLKQNFQAFPSGHTAVSSGFFAVLFFVSWRVGLLCLPIPLFVGFTRIFLGAHYFSDVVGAALLGILCAAIVAQFLLRPIRNQNQSGSDQSAIGN